MNRDDEEEGFSLSFHVTAASWAGMREILLATIEDLDQLGGKSRDLHIDDVSQGMLH